MAPQLRFICFPPSCMPQTIYIRKELSMLLSVNEQMEIITKGALVVIQTEDLQEKLRRGRPLRIKLGLDP